jgi:hypothetical protein
MRKTIKYLKQCPLTYISIRNLKLKNKNSDSKMMVIVVWGVRGPSASRPFAPITSDSK